MVSEMIFVSVYRMMVGPHLEVTLPQKKTVNRTDLLLMILTQRETPPPVLR